jgi:hypothetical protein
MKASDNFSCLSSHFIVNLSFSSIRMYHLLSASCNLLIVTPISVFKVYRWYAIHPKLFVDCKESFKAKIENDGKKEREHLGYKVGTSLYYGFCVHVKATKIKIESTVAFHLTPRCWAICFWTCIIKEKEYSSNSRYISHLLLISFISLFLVTFSKH